MPNRVHIICHPYAGYGKGEKVLKEVQSILNSYKLEYIIHRTDYATHAEVITEQIISKGNEPYENFMMVIGGDGTLHEVVNMMFKLNVRIPLTFVPAGTGNDFANTWQKDKSVTEIIQTMLFSREPKTIPIFLYKENYSQRTGIIVNNMGFGFDAQVNYQTQKQKANLFNKIGLAKFNYLVSLFPTLLNVKHFAVSGEIDGRYFSFDDCTIVSILNTPLVGGGINIDTLTDPQKPEVAIIFYHDITPSDIISLLYSVLVNHNQHESNNFTRYSGQRLSLSIHEPMVGHVDGEVIDDVPAQLEVSVSNYPFYL